MNHIQDGIASPNPSYPQEVKTVTGENTIDIVGRNLYNKDTTIAGFLGNDGTFNASATAWNTSDYIRIVGGESYNFNFQPITAGSYWQSRTVFYDKNKNYLSGSDLNSYPTNYTQTFTAPSGAYYVRMSFTNANTYERKDIQVNTGSTATTYEAYTSESYPINLGSLELAKIGTYKDKIYKDETDGKWYKYGAIGKVIANGTTVPASKRVGIANSKYGFGIDYDNAYKGGAYEVGYIVCNKLENKTRDSVYNNTQGISIGATNDYYGTGCFLYITDTDAMSLTDFNTWLSSNNLTIYYVLATPTEIEITDTTLINQLEAIKLLSGTQNNFTIDADTLPTLNLNYIGEANPHL